MMEEPAGNNSSDILVPTQNTMWHDNPDKIMHYTATPHCLETSNYILIQFTFELFF
jgi:hypothetical protein